MLTKISDFVKTNPEKTERQAKQLTNGIQANELNLLSTKQKDVSMADLNLIFENWKTSIDSENGGYKI